LPTTNQQLLPQLIQVLRKSPLKPKPEDGAAYRNLLLASERLNPKQRWLVIELLRHWTGKSFGADNPEMWKEELGAWSKWFAQSYPKEPPLPNLASDKPSESKWKFDELLAFLDKDPNGKGNPAKGKVIFEKAQCIKCHKFGVEGEGVGPDLSDLRKRFKRADTLEAMLLPSKIISDQYRSTTVITKDGQNLTGIAAPQGDVVTVVLQDASKVVLKKADIDQQIASLVSVMPEKILDNFTREEVADLFAYLESEPPQKK
jgi:putative heme-binding domain-containing protein